MADPFIGEVRIFANNFAPRNWAMCDGQTLDISQNTALFALLGTIYGGDGRSTFSLPDLRGRAPVHAGRGPGLTPRSLGQRGGEARVTLTSADMPPHQHTLLGTEAAATTTTPDSGLFGVSDATYTTDMNNQTPLTTTTAAGAGEAHNNMQPYLGVYFVIALNGLFPSRA